MASAEKCFTFLWKLKNFSYYHQTELEIIRSPAFLVDAVGSTKWILWLYPRFAQSEYVKCLLRRVLDKSSFSARIKYEIALIAEDGSVLIANDPFTKEFLRVQFGEGFSAKREDIIRKKRSAYLPHDTLTVRCRIWKDVGEMPEDVRCTAYSRLEVEKRSFLWNVKNFTALKPEKKCTYQIKSVENEMLLMSVNLFVTVGLNSEEIIRFDLSLQDEAIKFASLKLFLITSSGIRVECNQEEIWFDESTECEQLTFTFTKNKLLEGNTMYLPNDILSLSWQWVFSRGVISVESEDDQFGCINPEVKIFDVETIKNDRATLLNAMVDNVKSAYDDHFLSDVKLKTKTSVFPAHKFILGASSSVFKAMFLSDMKEKISDVVNIDDLSDDTVNRMLLFIYTTRVEDLTLESTANLYVAADKYNISSLKDICSTFLKDNLSPKNACEALVLSNLHSDVDLKSAVQNYILKNGKLIVNSDEWKVLIESNSKLAAETLSLLFQ